MSHWLSTCPSGSVKLCHTRGEMEFITGEIKPLHRTPTSFFDLSWSPYSSMNLIKFNVNSWMVVEQDQSLEPSASPAGLFSFIADLSTGSLVSVHAGSFDHGSLLLFLQTSASLYPHKDIESLTRLALQNAHEAACEMVRPSSSCFCFQLTETSTQIVSRTTSTDHFTTKTPSLGPKLPQN